MESVGRRQRNDVDAVQLVVEGDESSLPQLTKFQQQVKLHLTENAGYAQVVSGITFGAHLHCYKGTASDDSAGATTSSSLHEHGDALVLCAEDTKCEKLDSDLRYLSVASRIANSTRKRLFVAFSQKNDQERETKEGEQNQRGIKVVEFITIT